MYVDIWISTINNNKKMVLSNDNKRSKIMGIILKSPAVIYRQLLRFTGVSNGLLSYILRNLETSKHIVVNRGDRKRTTDYFPKNMGTKEVHVMTSLANNTNREIVQCRFLLFLLQLVSRQAKRELPQ